MSGSSAHTFLPGLARSGSTHSFDGFANTLPADEEVSFPGPLAARGTIPDPVDTDAAVEDDTELVVRDAMEGREGMAILPFEFEFEGPARDVLPAPPPEDEVEAEGREARLGFMEVLTFSGLGTATDMIALSDKDERFECSV